MPVHKDMTEQALKEARKYEEEKDREISAEERPLFHLSSRCGWMNDPNGFSLYEGMYHLFYQYYPYAPQWGPMHWGHAVSRDLVTWQYLPAALAPDTSADCGGCFSGSAAVLDDGRHILMYTGVAEDPEEPGTSVQTQCLAFGDGLDYEKFSGNPVLTSDDLPEGLSRHDFRDPKVNREEDGTYTCVVGGCTEEMDGRILYFRSEDGLDWHFVSVLAANNQRFGTMWECPDFFMLDGRAVLLCSPMDMRRTEKYSGGHGTLCLIGDFQDSRLVHEQDQPVDYGTDFYATQTLLHPDGRRIMTAWMQNWDTLQNHEELRWYGQMILPRELSVRNGKLYQQPVRELMQYRKKRAEYCSVPISDRLEPADIRGRALDLSLTIRPGAADYRRFEIQAAADEEHHTTILYDRIQQEITVDRSCSGTHTTVEHSRTFRTKEYDGVLKLRLIVDRYSMELFVNDGEQTFTMVIDTDLSADRIRFLAEGEAVLDMEAYTLDLQEQ